MDTEIMIDPNVRVERNETFSALKDVRGPQPVKGQRVVVREPEADLVGTGIVTRIDSNAGLIYIAVDWPNLVPNIPPAPDQFGRLHGVSYAAASATRQWIVGVPIGPTDRVLSVV